uniref:Uncharacterized protein n=1 Tax=Tanacetum cinerariifolium TaxID=118510 RepID=A0A699GSW6_TANCI|nr:hypothetical protein [Tanacetum cinerariifolium]
MVEVVVVFGSQGGGGGDLDVFLDLHVRPSPYLMITVTIGVGEQATQVIREKTDEEFTDVENSKELADIQAINILNVECTTPYAEPLAITTTTTFKVSHEDAYDFDVDEAPHAATSFMANRRLVHLIERAVIMSQRSQSKLKDQLQGKDESIRKLKAQISNMKESKASNSNVSSGAVIPEKPKVPGSGLYVVTPKYVPPQKRLNREVNTPLTRKEIVSLVKKTNVSVNMSTRIKYVPEASKSKSKSEKKTHRNLPARSENVERVETPLRNLNKNNHGDSSLSVKHTSFISMSVSVCKTCHECLVFGNHDKCVVKNLKSANAKNPKINNDANVKQIWKVSGKVFASVVPLEKSRSVSTSEPAKNVIVTPRFSKKPLTSYKRKDRKIKDTSTGSPPNAVRQAINDPVIANDLPV